LAKSRKKVLSIRSREGHKEKQKKDLIPRILNSSFAKIHKYIHNKEIEKLPFLVHTKRKNRQEKEKERKENE